MKFDIAILATIGIALLAIDRSAGTSIQSRDAGRAGKIVVCYFGSWAKYRPGNGAFDVEQIDPFLCTHIIFGFAGLRAGQHTIYALDEYNELEENWGKGAYKRFTNLTLINPNVIPLLAIGGWNEGSAKYSEMASTRANRRTFIDSVIPFLQRQNFRGLDLDWEYPAAPGCCGGGVPEDKENFALLCEELREEFDRHGYLLTAAVSAGEPTIANGYDVPRVSRALDFINVMAYDFHGAWETFTGHHTPLGPLPTETGNETILNLKHAINFWINQGAPPEKLILGMGTYGRGFVLNNPSENGLYAPASQGIPAGPYTRESGFWGFNEICERFRADGNAWTVVRPEHYEAPYAYNGNLWIGYDDEESITVKAQWALSMNLGGGMFWSVETDDFRGVCGETNPLIKTLVRVLNGEVPTPGPTTTTTTTTPDPTASTTTTSPTTTTTTTTPAPSPDCTTDGISGERCAASFRSCRWTGSSWEVHHFNCPPGLLYDPTIQNCNYPDVIGC